MKRRNTYLAFLFLAFVGSAAFFIGLPFPGENNAAFHLDALPVSWHVLWSLAVLSTLAILFAVSWRNCRIVTDVRHVTTITQK